MVCYLAWQNYVTGGEILMDAHSGCWGKWRLCAKGMTTEGLTAITSTVLILHVCGARVCILAQNATSLVTLALPALPGYLLRQPELHLRVQPAVM